MLLILSLDFNTTRSEIKDIQVFKAARRLICLADERGNGKDSMPEKLWKNKKLTVINKIILYSFIL